MPLYDDPPDLRRISPSLRLRRLEHSEDVDIRSDDDPEDNYVWNWGWRWRKSELEALAALLREILAAGPDGWLRSENGLLWAVRAGSRIEIGRRAATALVSFEDWETAALLGGLCALFEEQLNEAATARAERARPYLERPSADRVSIDREDLLALVDLEWATRDYFARFRTPGELEPGQRAALGEVKATLAAHQRPPHRREP